MARLVLKLYYVITVPIAVFFILHSARIHPAYGMSWSRRYALGTRMFLNTIRVRTGTSYKSHLAMALKLLETPPDVPGDVVECGTWKGGSAVNLSLICQIVGRRLRIYDSFEGLPAGDPNDREARHYTKGEYCGTLAEVQSNIRRYGAIDRCDFIPGWFQDTLPAESSPVLLAFLDVDLEASLHTCVRYLWPRLVESGYIFIDEVVGVDYCALFYSERYWQQYFQRTPPGLIGAGTGLPLGEYYIGPWREREAHPMQHANAGAYTRKDMSGVWTYYPD
jgi:O-methyltransferase